MHSASSHPHHEAHHHQVLKWSLCYFPCFLHHQTHQKSPMLPNHYLPNYKWGNIQSETKDNWYKHRYLRSLPGNIRNKNRWHATQTKINKTILPTLAVLERLFDLKATPSLISWTLSKCHNPAPLARFKSLHSKANNEEINGHHMRMNFITNFKNLSF